MQFLYKFSSTNKYTTTKLQWSTSILLLMSTCTQVTADVRDGKILSKYKTVKKLESYESS